MLVSGPTSREPVLDAMRRLGYACAEIDDPYAAMAELCRRPLVYRAVVLGLTSLYREELSVIRAIKRRYPHIEVWLAQTDGRQGALAEAMRLGADGLLDADGLHRVALGGAAADEPALPSTVEDVAADPPPAPISVQHPDDIPADEPILSADELRALLQEQPALPQSDSEPT